MLCYNATFAHARVVVRVVVCQAVLTTTTLKRMSQILRLAAFVKLNKKGVNKITRGQTQENFLLTQERYSEIPIGNSLLYIPRRFLIFCFFYSPLSFVYNMP
jgi:hypothetical protein